MISRNTHTILLVAGFLSQVELAFADDDGQRSTIASLDHKTVSVEHSSDFADSSNKARENYRAFLDLAHGDPDKRAQAMRRLGDIELEASEAEQLARNVEAIGIKSQQDAVALFQSLLDTYPDFERNDSVLYQLARAHEAAGELENALHVLNDLVERYPYMPQIDEIHFRRGEMLFLQKHYDEAEAAYSAAIEAGEASRFYEQSLYKLGWSRFKLAWYEDSLSPFFELLDRKLAGVAVMNDKGYIAALGRANRELVDDTFRILSICFSYTSGADGIDAFFDTNGYPDFGFMIYQGLGDLYLEKQRFQDAAEAYRSFVTRNPHHPQAPEFQVAVIEAYRQGSFPTLVIAAKKEFVERYRMDSDFWQQNPHAQNSTTERYLRENLADLAQYYHAEAQRSSDRNSYLEAVGWYRTYLANFPDEADSANTDFLLAEALFQGQYFRDAIEVYERTAYYYAKHENSADAAFAAVLSHREYIATLTDAEKADWHQNYFGSGLRFGYTFPEHPESATVLTAIAEELFLQNQFDLAIEVGESVVVRDQPVDSTLVRTSLTVIAHSQFDLENYADAEQAYRSLQAILPADDLDTLNEVNERIASSIFKQGEVARDSGDPAAAVAHFRRLGTAVPGSRFRETAEYDAAATLISMAAWDDAVRVLEEIRHTFAENSFSDIDWKLAIAYQESGRKIEAADEFVGIADGPETDDEVKREALWRAADLYQDAGADDSEALVLETFVNRYPDPVAVSIEAHVRLLELAEKGDDTERKARILKDIVVADANAGEQRTDRTRYLAATASLNLAEPVRHEFATFGLTQPLVRSIERKRKLMEEALTLYSDAAAYDVAEVTTTATFRLGEIYQQFGADLMTSERPHGLDDLALQQYELLLEEQMFPFEEKAIEILAVNARRTADGVWDEWVERSFEILAILMPARYAKSARSEDAVIPHMDLEHSQELNQTGILLSRRGRFKAAESAYLDAVTENPDYALAHYNLGILNDLYLQRLDTALVHYERYQELVGGELLVTKWIADLRRRIDRVQPSASLTE